MRLHITARPTDQELNSAQIQQVIAAIAADPSKLRIRAVLALPDPAGYQENDIVFLNNGTGSDGTNIIEGGAWGLI